MTNKERAKLTISRDLNKKQIIIQISDVGYSTLENIIIAPEQFALALTGLGYQNCEIEKKE